MSHSYQAEGFHTVTPYIVASDAEDVIRFMKETFDAEEKVMMRNPDGSVMHAEFKIGDSMIMIGNASSMLLVNNAMFNVYVPDVDATYKRAVQAGGISEREPADQFYGDRTAGVKDSSGNYWYIATVKEVVTPEEMEKRMAAMSAAG